MLTNTQLNILAGLDNVISFEGTPVSYNATAVPRLINFNPGRGNGFGMLVKRGYVKLGRVRKDNTQNVLITAKGVATLAANVTANV